MTIDCTAFVPRVLRSHWFCIAPLIPFAAMFVLHWSLGLSNAVGGNPVGERPASAGEVAYNYCMVAAFYVGVTGYFVFSAARAIVDIQTGGSMQSGMQLRTAMPGIAIFIAKIALLGIGWYAFLTALDAWAILVFPLLL